MRSATRRALERIEKPKEVHSLSQWEIETCALRRCTSCYGLGILHKSIHKAERICPCVYRGVFNRCVLQYHECEPQGGTGKVKVSCIHFRADFINLAQRHLSPFQHKIFLRSFLGREVSFFNPPCKGQIQGARCRAAEILGRLFCEVRPYHLYPTIDYFGNPWMLSLDPRERLY